MDNNVWQSEVPIAPESLTAPAFSMPAGACDAHMHVFGPATFAAAPAARYTLPAASPEHYAAVARTMRIDRAVLVQPSFYGSDNAFLLEALKNNHGRWRGAVMLSEIVPASQLRHWCELGVRAIRVDLFKALANGADLRHIHELLARTCELAAELEWSVDLYLPGRLCWQLLALFPTLQCPVSIAHIGYLAPLNEVSDAQCDEFVDVVRRSPVWPKISGMYRYGPGAGNARAQSLARKLVATAPDRLLWGSDWPHVMATPQDTGKILNEFATLCEDDRVRHRILVTNPARLYGFALA